MKSRRGISCGEVVGTKKNASCRSLTTPLHPSPLPPRGKGRGEGEPGERRRSACICIGRQLFAAFLLLLAPFGNAWAEEKWEALPLFDVAGGKETTLRGVIEEVQRKKIVFVGEHHDRESHHMSQLHVISAMREKGVPLAIGLEMFRQDSQKGLDDWISRKSSDKDFQALYEDNWNFPYPLYSMIFEYARKMKMPLVGLNLPRAITRQVAQGGFESLTSEQKGKLHNVECKVDPAYMAFIKEAYGGHAHGQLNFTYFCEAQLVWDKVMAVHATDFLAANPAHSMVVITGTGHAWKKGIPEQVGQRSKASYAVFLPEVPNRIEKGKIGLQDADYLVLDLEK